MNHITNDDGQAVLAVGAPGSKARVLTQYPKLIARLESLYCDRGDSPGRAIDRAIEIIREAGIRSETETNTILSCTLYANEPAGSVTSLVVSVARSNKELFKATYINALGVCVSEKPDLYAWPASQVGIVANRMFEAIERGSFSHDGPAFKLTAKHLNIKPTRTAILAFWNS